MQSLPVPSARTPSVEDARLDPARGWVILPDEAVPARWRGRAIAMSLVPLLPEEARQVLAGGQTIPSVSEKEEAVARLAARGLTVDAIARQLDVSVRTVNRRLAKLRQLLGVSSTAQLAAELARRGF